MNGMTIMHTTATPAITTDRPSIPARGAIQATITEIIATRKSLDRYVDTISDLLLLMVPSFLAPSGGEGDNLLPLSLLDITGVPDRLTLLERECWTPPQQLFLLKNRLRQVRAPHPLAVPWSMDN